MLRVKIERMAKFFKKPILNQILEYCKDGSCPYNVGRTVCTSKLLGIKMKGVEGYVMLKSGVGVGHWVLKAKIKGAWRYFDPTQERQIKDGVKGEFADHIYVVKEYSGSEINAEFSRSGSTHLINVQTVIDPEDLQKLIAA